MASRSSPAASALPILRNLVRGERVSAHDHIETFDPFTGRPWAKIPSCSGGDVDAAVGAATEAFRSASWSGLTPTRRGRLLVELANLIERDAERLARLEVQDNGKLLAEMSVQLRYIPQWYRYFGGLADKIEGAVLPIDKPDMFTFTKREPLGVIACIVPWNSPLMLLSWKLAPALAAGNTVVIKPSEHASASTLAFVELFAEAGFPPGVVNTVTGLPDQAAVPLVRHPDVAKIAFTGGEAAGVAVYQAAAPGLKRLTLELGGKSPNIIFEDAVIDNAVHGAVSGIFAASGQTCLAGSRLLVQRSIHDEVVERLIALARTARLGNPMDADTQVGPITTVPQRERVLSYIEIARAEGARCVLGGSIPKSKPLRDGWFVEPTVLTGVDNSMRIAREEVFGPVLAVIPFADESEALAIANDTPYGLAAGVWTSDMGRAMRMSNGLQAGTVWVNCYRAVSFMAPFGGYKRSGIGRESGREAIDAYLQTKSVWIDTAGRTTNPFVIR